MRYTYNPESKKSIERIRAEQLGFKYSKLMEQNKKIQTAFFSPEAFVFYGGCIGLICAILQSLNII